MLASPLTLAQLFDHALFGVSVMSCVIPDTRRFNKTAGGLVISSERGARLWQGSIQMTPLPNADASEIDAKMAVLTGSGMSFLMYDSRAAYPRSDPTGSILGASSVILNTVNANLNDITLSGLPVGYVISPGDTLSFTYGSAPTRYALHRVVSGGTAGGTGITGSIQVSPPLRTGYVAGTSPVKLVKALMTAVVVPGSYSPPNFQPGKVSSPGSFDFTQTLRG